MEYQNIGHRGPGLWVPKANKSKKSTDTQSVEDIEQAIEKLKGDDRVGSAGELLTTVGGVAAGGVAAGSIAAAAGATTLLGSTSLAGIFGGVFVATTPVGWVAGCAVAGGAIAYGVSQLVKSGGRNDKTREEFIEKLSKRIAEINAKNAMPSDMTELQICLNEAIRGDYLTQEDATRLIGLVEAGKLKCDIALSRIRGLMGTK